MKNKEIKSQLNKLKLKYRNNGNLINLNIGNLIIKKYLQVLFNKYFYDGIIFKFNEICENISTNLLKIIE